MSDSPVTVLVAGDPETSAMLQKWLIPRNCECRFADTFADAWRTLSQTNFDIVLCQYDLPDRTALPLLDSLEGTQSTLLFYARVGKNSRWLPVIDRGRRCLDRPSMREHELPDALGRIVEAVRQGQPKRSNRSDAPPNVQGTPRADLVSSGSR